MAIDPNILLQRTVPDVGSALLRGLQGVQAIQSMQQAAAEAPLRQQILETQAEALRDANLASKVKALISPTKEGKFEVSPENINTAKRLINESSLSEQDKEFYDLYIDAGRWEQLNNISDQAIQRARDIGVYERDYGLSLSGYETAASKNIALLNELEKQYAAGQLTDSEFYSRRAILLRPQTVETGGGAKAEAAPGEVFLRPYELPSVTGGGVAPVAPAAAPTVPTVTPDRLAPPPPPPAAPGAGRTLRESIAEADQMREFAKRYGTEAAKDVAELENTADVFEVNKAGFDQAYPEIKLRETLENAPNSRVGQIFAQGIGNFLQGVPEVDADYELGQAFRAAVGLIPFPPGAQSEAEQRAREAEVGDLINAKISKESRINAMSRLLNREQTKSMKRWEIANRRRREVGLPEIDNPFSQMPTREVTGAARSTPTGGSQGVPTGVDPADWAVMTPEERALWQ